MNGNGNPIRERRDRFRAMGLCCQCGKAPIYRGSLCLAHYENRVKSRALQYQREKERLSSPVMAAVVVLDLDRDGPFCRAEGCSRIALHREHK